MKRIMQIRNGIVLLPLLLAACGGLSTIQSDKVDYKSQSSKLPPLEIPPDLTKPGTDDRFVVPDINARGPANASDYNKDRSGRPNAATSLVLPSQDDAHIERSGSQRWLVVKGEPDAVWNVAKQFWQELGFIVNLELPDAGVLETDWAENRARVDSGALRNFLGRVLDSVYSTAERDKYRTRLERGSVPGTTEIFISHRGILFKHRRIYRTS